MANTPNQEDSAGGGGISLILSIIPGLGLMAGIAFLAKAVIEPWLEENVPFVTEQLNINNIIMVIVVGLVIRNTISVPSWAADGVKMSRLCIKTGIVLLGTLYSVASIAALGLRAAVLISVFVVGAALAVLFFGRLLGMSRSDASALGAGVGVCGVSAIVATAPAVRARAAAIGLSVATILAFGVISLFVFPLIGKFVDMDPALFGAWAGIGILNSGQVLAASLAYDPGSGSESLLVGQIFNVVRVILLPVIVLVFATYMSIRESEEEHERGSRQSNLQIIMNTFPVFVLGFIGMVILTTLGVFGSTEPEPSPALSVIDATYGWLFAIGLTGFGMQISIAEMRRAGGAPFIVGFGVGTLKAVLALVVILLIGEDLIPEGVL